MNPEPDIDAPAPAAKAAPPAPAGPAARLGRRLCRTAATLAAALLLAAAAVALALWSALQPAPGEPRYRVQWHGIAVDLGLPATLRLATHPLAAPLLDGRTFATPLGRWHWRTAGGAPLAGRCAPCSVRIAALGAQPLRLDEARIEIHRAGAARLHGTLWLGRGADALSLAWRAELARDAVVLDLELPDGPAERAVRAFGASMPEAAGARIDGTFGLAAQARWGAGQPPGGSWRVQPRLLGLAVAGLGTERLLAIELPAACRTAGASAAPQGWLPRAVIAAEDQRFYEHPGYDLAQMLAAWQHNQSGAALQGGSTLTQQLAKLVFTGADRSPARKLRELLYAVEMEQTLGKGRILQLYLALAPWGDGVCGAPQAARAHLGRDVNTLGPVAAAWLASLLKQPDAQLRKLEAGGPLDSERMRHILVGMRPMSPAQRERALQQMTAWRPPAALHPQAPVAPQAAP